MNTIEALYVLKYNPFKYGKYLATFYSKLSGVEQNLLLSPLLIPLLTHPIFKEKIKNCKSTSSLHTIFFSNYKELYDLQERINSFKALTIESIHYCLINEWIKINIDNLSITSEQDVHDIRIAEKLARLLSNHTIQDIYSVLGVKP
ncbi:three component ABC system middle component [Gallibacterium melopsittaci]|uniref:Three component ABC system middle component n=1 Tax=Gallibacterium melopsittaci TaxID=516063 RepID=A0ABV6HW02_9PAST